MFTYNDALQYIDKAVSDYGPDWTDPNYWEGGCKNVYEYEGETRHCIVGHALTAAIPSISWLNWEAMSAEDVVERLREDGHEISEDAEALLYVAQSLQDVGLPWGVVRDNVERVYADYSTDGHTAITRAIDELKEKCLDS